MKILCTGATGGLGRSLVPRLVEQERLRVKALAHRSPLTLDGCEEATGDLNNPESLERVTVDIDTVVHLAALTHTNRRDDYFRVNLEGTRNLLKASVKNGVRRFVYVSSRTAHPKGGGYSESKFQAEELVKKSGLSWVILRPAEVYGEGSPDAINKLVRWIQKFKVVPIIGNGQYRLSPVFIDDVVLAMTQIIAMENLRGVTLTLGGPEEISFTSLVDRISRFLGVKRLKIFVPVLLVQCLVESVLLLKKDFLARDQIPRLLCDKLPGDDIPSDLLPYRPRKLEDGLRRFLSPGTV
ncbi:MAG: NAD-dependent epimerase/dehydratase family protein [Nitrospinales bacterium]